MVLSIEPFSRTPPPQCWGALLTPPTPGVGTPTSLLKSIGPWLFGGIGNTPPYSPPSHTPQSRHSLCRGPIDFTRLPSTSHNFKRPRPRHPSPRTPSAPVRRGRRVAFSRQRLPQQLPEHIPMPSEGGRSGVPVPCVGVQTPVGDRRDVFHQDGR